MGIALYYISDISPKLTFTVKNRVYYYYFIFNIVPILAIIIYYIRFQRRKVRKLTI